VARSSSDVGRDGQRKRVAEALLAHLGLRHYFSAVVAADHVKNHKPAPDTFLLCAERMGVAPEKCVVFEDADFGLQAARAPGWMLWMCVCCE
jgi:HAD superfamily hydrolase (TIGR01509 family)